MALTLDEARALHAEVPVVDLHADTTKLMDKLGYDLAVRHERRLPGVTNIVGHVDLPRLREGGVAAQFFAFWTWPGRVPGTEKSGMRSVMSQLDARDAAIAANPGELAWARTGADIRAAMAAGKIAALGGVEGGHCLEGRVENIETLARRGARYLGPLHLWPNALGGSSRKKDEGLTAHGADVIRECERCGVIVDLAHISKTGFREALEIATAPVMVTHTGVNAVHESWRNLDDAQIHQVADRGGCVGIIFARQHLGGASIDDVVEHMLHVLNLAGEDAPALGSDFDGFVAPTRGLEDVSALPNLTVALSRRGIPPRVLEKILGGNVLRLLDDVPAWGKLAA